MTAGIIPDFKPIAHTTNAYSIVNIDDIKHLLISYRWDYLATHFLGVTAEMEGLNAVPPSADAEKPEVEVQEHKPKRSDRSAVLASAGTLGSSLEAISALLNETLEKAAPKDFAPSRRPFDRNEPAAGSVVISGTCFYHSSEDISPSSDAGELIRDLVEAAALGALKDGGIPLIRRDSADNGEPSIEEDWILPKPLQQETGIITASGYPDLEALQRIQGRYETYKKIVDELVVVNQSGRLSPADRSDQIRIVAELMRELSADTGDGRDAYMTLEALGFDYGKLAAELEALGPVAHLRPGAACASEAMSLADDWIRTGRCRRVIIVCTLEAAGDGLNSLLDIHSDTSERPAALEGPNKQKRSAQLSAFSILIESEDAVSERGMRGIVELLGSETLPQTTGSTRHIIDHLSGGVERLVDGAEKRFVLYRAGMARHLVFLISESGDYGSEYPVEVAAFESVFGAAADQATITSTSALVKNGVGSVLGAAIAIKILESGHVPPAPVGWLEIPALDPYRFGNGSYTDPKYILYMAGLSRSRVAMNLFRLISREIVRVDDLSLYHRWVEGISGYEEVFVETGDRMLKLVGTQAVGRKPLPSPWRYGLGPTLLAPEEEPAPLVESEPLETPAAVQQEHAEPQDTAIELPPEAARFLEQGLDPEDVRILMVAAKYMGVALEALEIDKDLESDLGMSDQEHAELLI
ncbi:MAG: hypothetical protein ACK2T3_10160, partial [Candidatus Promineifilaceae bacterium]